MIQEAGEEALYQLKVQQVHPDMIKLLGRLKFLFYHGQNVLLHLKECALLMGSLASELDLDVSLAKRAGLFHDIGKAIEKDVEEDHDVVGSEIAKRYGEEPLLINAIEAHHGRQKYDSPIACLTSAVNVLSGSRSGARSEKMQNYMQRLEKLERIVNSFNGVQRCYSLQGGREVRVFADSKRVDDSQTEQLARDISKKIKDSLDYPGEIKITVIRETRTTEITK